MRLFNVPNILTTARIALIPVFISAILYGRYRMALVLFIAAALTDLLDGLLARATGQKTPIGEFLDPLADKSVLITSFVLFSYHGWIPKWLAIAVISRDIIVVIGWMMLFFLMNIRRVEPSVLGKLSTVTEFLLLCYVLFGLNYGLVTAVTSALVWITAVLTVLSGLHYIVYRGLKIADEGR